MINLIELRGHIREWYGKYDRYLRIEVRFLMALLIFLMINYNIGYMSELKHVYVALMLAVICAFLPGGMTIFLGAALAILHLYALSAEVAGMAAVMFLIMFLLYFRFEPKNGAYVMLTPLAFACRIPYIMPVATGLVKEPQSVISVVFGTVVYYFLQGVKNNASLLGGAAVGEENVNKLTVTLNQLLGNKEMYLIIAVMILASVVVYNVRRMAIDHAWRIAIGAGILTQFVILTAGYIIMGSKGSFFWLLIGSFLSWILSMLLEFLFFNLDYHRTERVQFEDDEYYYYVKAVPKINLSSGEKKVQKIAGTEKED